MIQFLGHSQALGNHVRDILHYTTLKCQHWVPKLLLRVTMVCKVKRLLSDSDMPEGKLLIVPKFSIMTETLRIFFFLPKNNYCHSGKFFK